MVTNLRGDDKAGFDKYSDMQQNPTYQEKVVRRRMYILVKELRATDNVKEKERKFKAILIYTLSPNPTIKNEAWSLINELIKTSDNNNFEAIQIEFHNRTDELEDTRRPISELDSINVAYDIWFKAKNTQDLEDLKELISLFHSNDNDLKKYIVLLVSNLKVSDASEVQIKYYSYIFGIYELAFNGDIKAQENLLCLFFTMNIPSSQQVIWCFLNNIPRFNAWEAIRAKEGEMHTNTMLVAAIET